MPHAIYIYVFVLIINAATEFSSVFAVNNEPQTQIQTSHPGYRHCQFNSCPSVDVCSSNCKSCLRGFPHIKSIFDLSSNTCICFGWNGELLESEIKDLVAAATENDGKFDNGFREIACEQILKTDEMAQLTEAGMCKAKSHHFHGGCLGSHKCALVCRNESGGRCRGFGCRCFCPKLC